MANAMNQRSLLQRTGLILGPVLFFLVMMINIDPANPMVGRMAAVATLMAVFWVTEAVPLAATALIPVILFPLLGIMKGKAAAGVYFNSTIFLFMGGFLIALAMEKWKLHKRIALFTVKTIGGGPSRLVFGFMAASAFLSMWISNTATAVMMLPIAMSIILKMEEQFDEKATHHFTLCLLLGIAYAASMGGAATLVGTPPNLVLVRTFEQTFPTAAPISFGVWMMMALPLSAAMLVTIWFLLTRVFFRVPAHLTVDHTIVEKEYKNLGPLSPEEKSVLVIFLLTALLWIFRKDLNLGFMVVPGWAGLMPFPKLIDDGTVAVTMASLLFILPTRSDHAKSAAILDACVFSKLPWGIILLFGGGFALAKGFQASGLSAFIGSKLGILEGANNIFMISGICTTLTFLTELTSNTATTQMILPILSSIAVAMKTNPLMLLIPATLSASCAFMMPVATPPNAIIFGSGRVKIYEMVKAGIFINFIGIVVITGLFLALGTAVFAIDPNVIPDWALLASK
ncbi:MAG: DASS family sodium-coupled anion symporter [Desulfobacter sp.]|nr:MAG: DASS family sodium-coupled anion symporter [Desulfobacter sp.]